MRFHVLSLPHTSTTKDYESCAYTTKARRFSDMMMSLGHQVFLYGGPLNTAECTEHIVIASEMEQKQWFGEFDFHNNFYPITWGVTNSHWVGSNKNAIKEISKRIQPMDFICILGGNCQEPIAREFPLHPVVEYGIGYDGVFAKFKVFESYAHMHNVYGMTKTINGGYYDAVIPNYYDPNDFNYSLTPTEDREYYAYLGRFIERKGVEIAIELTRQLGVPLVMAGQGCHRDGNALVSQEGFRIEDAGHVKHIGHVGVKERVELLKGAKATIVPTIYLEPFGGVSVESLFCGTPVIVPDFGVFTETIPHGQVGYRFRTLGEAAYMANNLDKLWGPKKIAQYARGRFSMDVVKYKYEDYFKQILGLYDGTSDWYGPWHGRLDRYKSTLD